MNRPQNFFANFVGSPTYSNPSDWVGDEVCVHFARIRSADFPHVAVATVRGRAQSDAPTSPVEVATRSKVPAAGRSRARPGAGSSIGAFVRPWPPDNW